MANVLIINARKQLSAIQVTFVFSWTKTRIVRHNLQHGGGGVANYWLTVAKEIGILLHSQCIEPHLTQVCLRCHLLLSHISLKTHLSNLVFVITRTSGCLGRNQPVLSHQLWALSSLTPPRPAIGCRTSTQIHLRHLLSRIYSSHICSDHIALPKVTLSPTLIRSTTTQDCRLDPFRLTYSTLIEQELRHKFFASFTSDKCLCTTTQEKSIIKHHISPATVHRPLDRPTISEYD